MIQIEHRFSENFNERHKQIDALVLHYTGMKTPEEALNRLCDKEAKVSAHYVILEDGKTIQLVEEEKRAWHAGNSLWEKKDDLNTSSIGIEIVNKGHEFGYTPFPAPQMQSVISLCQDILKRRKIPQTRILAHSDIAPTRKEDPGELFNWQELYQNDIGLWTNDFAPVLLPASVLLERIGYDISDEKAALIAFQRRFYPEALLNKGKQTLERLSAVDALYQKYRQESVEK